MMTFDGQPQTVDYCVISDFEADDFIAILILMRHITTEPKTDNKPKTLHIHISGSKGKPEGPDDKSDYHGNWYTKHATDLIQFLDAMFPFINMKISTTISCSKNLDVAYKEKQITQPTNQIKAETLFLLGPMYDMGICCDTEKNTLISGNKVYAYFGFNVPQMYVDQTRFLYEGKYANVFDNIGESDITNINSYKIADSDAAATDWLRVKLNKSENTVFCYNKPDMFKTNLENIGVENMAGFKLASKLEPIRKALKSAEYFEPTSFADLLFKTGMPKFAQLWIDKIINPILEIDINTTIITQLETLKTNLNQFVNDKNDGKSTINPNIKQILGNWFEQVNIIYQDRVPVNPGWADSMPIVAFIKHQNQNTEKSSEYSPTKAELLKYLNLTISKFDDVYIKSFPQNPLQRIGGGKARKATKNAWIDHVRSVYQKSIGSANPLSWMQAMKAAKSTYTKRS